MAQALDNDGGHRRRFQECQEICVRFSVGSQLFAMNMCSVTRNNDFFWYVC